VAYRIKQTSVYSDVEQKMELIKKIQTIDLNAFSIDELVEMITPLFKGLQMNAPIIKKGTKIYRTRIVKQKTKNISEVGVPPKNKITKLGRLNNAGEQIGYFSTSRRSAYFETTPKEGDFVILTRWILKQNLILVHVGYIEEAFGDLDSNRKGNEYGWAKETQGFNKRNKEIYNFLSQQFVKNVPVGEEYLYKLTISIARKFMKNGPQDGLLYPTIAMKGNTDNIALNPESLSKINLLSIEFNKIQEKKDFGFELTKIDSATKWNSVGDIVWNSRKLNWTIGPGKMATAKAEDGEWVLYDEENKEIFQN